MKPAWFFITTEFSVVESFIRIASNYTLSIWFKKNQSNTYWRMAHSFVVFLFGNAFDSRMLSKSNLIGQQGFILNSPQYLNCARIPLLLKTVQNPPGDSTSFLIVTVPPLKVISLLWLSIFICA